MAEYVEVSAVVRLGREVAPPRRVNATVASGKEWVVLRGEAVLFVHHLGDEGAPCRIANRLSKGPSELAKDLDTVRWLANQQGVGKGASEVEI
jgi:hypothetical protein